MTASSRPDGLRVLIAGASGLIGTELQKQLRSGGHSVSTLVRRESRNATEVTWNPSSGTLDAHELDEIDAVINLSGASLNKLPWTNDYREKIRSSRIAATRTLVEAMAKASPGPKTFLSGSAVGIYGSRPGERLTESSVRGDGFLADVVEAWEQTASEAHAGIRTVFLRTGVVLSPTGGALAPVKLLTRFGVSGPLGGGRQVWPWISLRDEAAAIVHLLTSDLSGPVNLTGPTPASSAEIGRHLAKRIRRPFLIPAPKFAVEALLGDAGRELLLADQEVAPTKLVEDGFVFRDRTSDQAVDASL